MKIIIAIIFLLSSSLIFGQTIFFEEFNNNTNSWATGKTENYNLSIAQGEYFFEHYREKGIWMTWKKVEINEALNFRISTKIRKISGIQNHGYGFGWGLKDVDNLFAFDVSGNGQFQLSKCTNGKWTNVKNWEVEESIFQGNGSINSIAMEKKGNYMYLYINNKKVFSTIYQPFFGNKISFHVNNKQKIAIDYLRVEYLPKEQVKQNFPPEIVITHPEDHRGFAPVQAQTITVAGKVTDSDGIASVRINGKQCDMLVSGYFSSEIPVQPGKNTITIEASDLKGKTAYKTITVNRSQPQINPLEDISEKRVALIFGNSDYKGAASLGVNPINDAQDISTVLQSLNFSVILKTNADLTTMNNAIREFGRSNRDADIALFFFAGHGMQVERENYLLPIGVNVRDKNDVNFECVSVNTVQKIMETSNPDRLNLIILDACRNNPFRSWQRGGETGLADMNPPSGTLIAFATSPGSTASNGNQRNGLYTGELIKQLQIPQRIEDVFIHTRVNVENKSGGSQSPWELARLRGVYFLKR